MESDHVSEWLDIRGNHDTFDVIDDHQENNFFARYSIQGINNRRSYFKVTDCRKQKISKTFNKRNNFSKKVVFQNQSLGFIGLDATLVPGPKRPFNFFGALNQSDFNVVESLIDKAKEETDYHFVFGHYPTRFANSFLPFTR